MTDKELMDKVKAIALTASREFPSDISAATNWAVERVGSLGVAEYQQLTNLLIHAAVRDLVYDARHVDNTTFKRNTGYYDPKLHRTARKRAIPEEGGEVAQAYQSVYEYRIAGRILGDLKGTDLPQLIEAETARADGHHFNASLLRWCLDNGVKEEKTVRSIPEGRLRNQFRKLQKEMAKTA